MTSDINQELRTEVAQRAGQRCEYCLIHEDDAGFPHQVEHIFSRKHGVSSTSDNLETHPQTPFSVHGKFA